MKSDYEYQQIINPIMNNEKVKSLENIKHHDNNRLKHSLRVSYYSYKITKFLGLEYNEVARAGLLHDFYLNRVKDCNSIKEKVKLFASSHPNDAYNNSKKYFSLSEREENIIKSHMFPLNTNIPKYKESWIVSIVDKCVSTYEFSNKFSKQFVTFANLYLLFMINYLK